MVTLVSKSIYQSTFARIALLALMALSGAASPARGQEMIVGKFTLTQNTRLGSELLPAGAYTFSVEPAGILRSLDSIQGVGDVVEVIVRPETKAGPAIGIFAVATRTTKALDSSKLVLTSVNDGMAAHTMYLGKQGLVLDFAWWKPKEKTQMVAQAKRPEAVLASK